MKIDEKILKKILDTWHDSQFGHYKKCQEKQWELSEMLRGLHEQMYGEDE